MKPPLKLHLGCGRRKIHGFLNVDALPACEPDMVADVFTLPSIRPRSVGLIYACHVLEHAERHTCHRVLARWFELLRPGGKLRLATPDLKAAAQWYMQTERLDDIIGLLYGGQRDGYDHHGFGWDEFTLTRDLAAAGFVGIHRWDWRAVEHYYVDDYSQAHLPAISYASRRPGAPIEGKLVSLNLEAYKP